MNIYNISKNTSSSGVISGSGTLNNQWLFTIASSVYFQLHLYQTQNKIEYTWCTLIIKRRSKNTLFLEVLQEECQNNCLLLIAGQLEIRPIYRIYVEKNFTYWFAKVELNLNINILIWYQIHLGSIIVKFFEIIMPSFRTPDRPLTYLITHLDIHSSMREEVLEIPPRLNNINLQYISGDKSHLTQWDWIRLKFHYPIWYHKHSKSIIACWVYCVTHYRVLNSHTRCHRREGVCWRSHIIYM